MENDVSKSKDSTLRLVIKVLEEAGIEFFWDDDGTVGLKLKPTDKYFLADKNNLSQNK